MSRSKFVLVNYPAEPERRYRINTLRRVTSDQQNALAQCAQQKQANGL